MRRNHTSRFRGGQNGYDSNYHPDQPVTYSLLVIFTVDPGTHERLQDQQDIRAEAESWLASLDATVHGVNIRKAD